jgi:predicted transcriptional regulator
VEKPVICPAVLKCITDKPITSQEIEVQTGLKRKDISACLTRYFKEGKIKREKVEASNKLGPRMVYVYTLVESQET